MMTGKKSNKHKIQGELSQSAFVTIAEAEKKAVRKLVLHCKGELRGKWEGGLLSVTTEMSVPGQRGRTRRSQMSNISSRRLGLASFSQYEIMECILNLV